MRINCTAGTAPCISAATPATHCQLHQCVVRCGMTCRAKTNCCFYCARAIVMSNQLCNICSTCCTTQLCKPSGTDELTAILLQSPLTLDIAVNSNPWQKGLPLKYSPSKSNVDPCERCTVNAYPGMRGNCRRYTANGKCDCAGVIMLDIRGNMALFPACVPYNRVPTVTMRCCCSVINHGLGIFHCVRATRIARKEACDQHFTADAAYIIETAPMTWRCVTDVHSMCAPLTIPFCWSILRIIMYLPPTFSSSCPGGTPEMNNPLTKSSGYISGSLQST